MTLNFKMFIALLYTHRQNILHDHDNYGALFMTFTSPMLPIQRLLQNLKGEVALRPDTNLIYKIFKAPYLRLTYSKAQQPKTVSLEHKRDTEIAVLCFKF